MITHKHRKYIEIRCLHDFVTQHKFEFEWIFIVYLVFLGIFWVFVCLFVVVYFERIYLITEEANEIVQSLMKGKEEALEFRCISV